MNKMKRITLFTAALLTFAGMQAQNSIDQVLRNIEANNKELQANARLISSQKLEAKTDNNLADPTLSYAHLWGSKDKSETIGELVVSQSFDFPSLYASRAKLNRLKTNSFDGQASVFARASCCKPKRFVWILLCFANNSKYCRNGCVMPKSLQPCTKNVCKPVMPM